MTITPSRESTPTSITVEQLLKTTFLLDILKFNVHDQVRRVSKPPCIPSGCSAFGPRSTADRENMRPVKKIRRIFKFCGLRTFDSWVFLFCYVSTHVHNICWQYQPFWIFSLFLTDTKVRRVRKCLAICDQKYESVLCTPCNAACRDTYRFLWVPVLRRLVMVIVPR